MTLLMLLLAANPPGPQVVLVPVPVPVQVQPAAPPAPPPPECRISNGVEICGYHCLVHPRGGACSRTPEGMCQVLDGEVYCFDPPEEVRLHLTSPAPVPICKSKYGTRTCGYSCESSPTKLGCTQSPWGRCKASFDELTCWDPPPETVHAFAPNLSGSTCVSTQRMTACGWNCKTSYQEAACAQTPNGRCSVYQGKVQCIDAPVAPIMHGAR